MLVFLYFLILNSHKILKKVNDLIFNVIIFNFKFYLELTKTTNITLLGFMLFL